MKKNVIRTMIVGSVWIVLAVSCFAKPKSDISVSERRPLKQFPNISLETILDGSFMTDFEKYTLDQFPLRDSFRSLKAVTAFYGFRNKDNNGIYVADGYAASLEYPLNEGRIDYATGRFEHIYNKYLKDNCENVFVSVVPDKNYFLGGKNGYLTIDYDRLFSKVKENMNFAKYIDITGVLEVEDYYKTDSHWRQEKIIEVANKLALGMNMSPVEMDNFEIMEADVDFYGVYYGQAALPMDSESIYYLINDVLKQCTVYNYETNKKTGIYNMDKLTSRDPYDMFLSGPTALLTIENENSSTDKELIVFRDSFGSSLIPLIADQYAKITIVDIRYISSNLLGNYIDFNGQDVLFLYSTTLLNNSTSLK